MKWAQPKGCALIAIPRQTLALNPACGSLTQPKTFSRWLHHQFYPFGDQSANDPPNLRLQPSHDQDAEPGMSQRRGAERLLGVVCYSC
jgi:hypothetical protein